MFYLINEGHLQKKFSHHWHLRIDTAAELAVSDLMVNLSAGWLGTIVISPVFIDLHSLSAIIILSSNALLGTMSLLGTIAIRRHSNASFSAP